MLWFKSILIVLQNVIVIILVSKYILLLGLYKPMLYGNEVIFIFINDTL